MPRFVVLYHQCPPDYERPSHWDVMLESAGVLRTWALAERPNSDVPVSAEALPDHRLHYLTYEGPISGGRGSVARWDGGEYSRIEETPEKLRVELRGEELAGNATLRRQGDSWEWIFSPAARQGRRDL